MPGPTAGFDVEGFYLALDATRQSRKLTWRSVAKAAGISPSTLTRMAQGKRPDVDSLAKLTVWSGLTVDDYVAPHSAKASAEPMAAISTLLRSDKNLSPESADALDELIKLAYRRMTRDD